MARLYKGLDKKVNLEVIKKLNSRKPIIELKKVSKIFQNSFREVHVLSDVDLTIYEGEIFGIIGMSGAGKSTLVRCINFLEKPTSGEIIVDGKVMSQLNKRGLSEIRRKTGMIFQQFNLLMQRTALKNVCFPMEIAGVSKAQSESRARELLELVGLSDRMTAYPSQLSGGQKQRIAIARALATNPKVLLSDEATSALDPDTTRGVLALLKKINKKLGVTIVMITHEMSIIEEICSRVAIIDKGRIAEVGMTEDVFVCPNSDIGRKLVYPEGRTVKYVDNSRCCRIVFEGCSSLETVISNMVLECKAPVNILFADTKNIDGQIFGQMVIQLPEDQSMAQRMLTYLNELGIKTEEVKE